MSLYHAVLAIADSLDKQALEPLESAAVPWILKGYAGQLRAAAMVAGPQALLLPVNHQAEIDKARLEFRKAVPAAEQEPRMVELAGATGPSTYVPVPGDMPLGARTLVNGAVHILAEDGRLHRQPG